MEFGHTYAPNCIDELVFADHRVKLQMSDVFNEFRHPNILLHGPFGSGKSVLAKILVRSRVDNIDEFAKHFVWQASDISKQFLSKNRLFNDFLKHYNHPTSNHTYAVIDEVDHISKPLQQELRAFLDKKHSSCHLIMTTNDIKRVDNGIVSRSEAFFMDHPSAEAWVPRMQDICKQEGCRISSETILNYLPQGAVNARDMISVCEQLVLDHWKRSGQVLKEKRQRPPKNNALFELS